jgi:pimeloyl-ACP methyl ester carboxylesterase
LREIPAENGVLMSDVVLIHGAWVGPACWDPILTLLKERGWSCTAPAWPYDDRPVSELRTNRDARLAGVGIKELVDHYESVVKSMATPPLLVGHSFGGLVVQMLLDRGVGRAGVAINTAPTKGIMPSASAVRANQRVLFTPRSWRRILEISEPDFAWAFLHNLSPSEQRRVYDEQVVPTPGRPFWQAALAPFNSATRVDYRRDRPPLLLIAGGADRTVTEGMNRANARKYSHSPAVTEFVSLPGRSHWTIAEPGYEKLVELIEDFDARQLARPKD